jgi:hypothetical protein
MEESVAEQIAIDQLTTQGAGGFVGCTMGVYGYSKKADTSNAAIFGSLHVLYP